MNASVWVSLAVELVLLIGVTVWLRQVAERHGRSPAMAFLWIPLGIVGLAVGFFGAVMLLYTFDPPLWVPMLFGYAGSAVGLYITYWLISEPRESRTGPHAPAATP